MVLSVVSARITAPEGELCMRRIQKDTRVGMQTVCASGQEGILLSSKEGNASKWMRAMEMSLMRVEVFQHLLS